jgi:hypothetical protein
MAAAQQPLQSAAAVYRPTFPPAGRLHPIPDHSLLLLHWPTLTHPLLHHITALVKQQWDCKCCWL